MNDHPYTFLQAVPRGSKVEKHHHVVYSQRWRYLLAGLGMAGMASLGASIYLRRWRWAQRLVASMIGVGVAGGVQALSGIWRLQIERHTLQLPLWNPQLNGLRVAQLSDLHLRKTYAEFVLRRALHAVHDFQPDIIFLTGDYLYHADDLPLLREMLQGIRAPLGVFAILGNHDYWDNPAEIAGVLHELGISVLINEHRVVTWRDADFIVAGVADPWQADADLDRALSDAPRDLPIILLAHGPDFITTAQAHGVALQLSGHAHAGHINLPWFGPYVLPRWGMEYPHGQFVVGDSYLYVSRGMGGLPIRFGALPEVGLLTLVQKK